LKEICGKTLISNVGYLWNIYIYIYIYISIALLYNATLSKSVFVLFQVKFHFRLYKLHQVLVHHSLKCWVHVRIFLV